MSGQPTGSTGHPRFFLSLFFLKPSLVPAPGRPGPRWTRRVGPGFKTIILRSHYLLGWSFKINGQAEALDISQLPWIGPKKTSRFLTIGLPVICLSLVLVAVSCIVYAVRRTRKFAEVLEDGELDYGPHWFKYKNLYISTKGFRDKELLGGGGFGRVYKGVLPTSKIEIAVKGCLMNRDRGWGIFGGNCQHWPPSSPELSPTLRLLPA